LITASRKMQGVVLENIDHYREDIAELVRALDETSTELIDFDRLRLRLAEMVSLIEEKQKLETEVRILRDDYIGRMAGMLKAIAAVNNRTGEMGGLLDDVERLPALGASELVAVYRRVSARFRSAFPASVGWLGSPRRYRRAADEVSDYK
jgi:hypothetical protein